MFTEPIGSQTKIRANQLALGDAFNFTGAVTLNNSATFTIANSPTGATESGNTVTITTTAACPFVTGEAILISGVGVTTYNGAYTVLSPGCNGGSTFTYRNPTTSLAASGGGTAVGGNPVLNGRTSFISGIGANTFTGPSPWIDVTDPAFGAKCDGVTDDTAAIQSALNTANLQPTSMGGVVYIPVGHTAPCVVATALSLDGMTGVSMMDGDFLVNTAGGNASQASLKFTGACLAAACLSIRSAGDIVFWGVRMSFPNLGNGTCTNSYNGVTLCPAIDLAHSGLGTDGARIKFHGGAIIGPGVATGGPLVLDQNTTFTLFDQHIQFTNASVFVSGPVNNAAGFTDKAVFRDVQFYLVGTAAIQNASVDWTFEDCIFTLRNGAAGTNGEPALQYVNSYNNQQNLVMIGNEFLMQISPTNTFTLLSLPAVSGNLGGLKLEGNLMPVNDANMTVLNLGNGQQATVSTDTIGPNNTFLNVGTSVQLTVGPNNYSAPFSGTFMVGTPQNGLVTANTGVTTLYSGTNIAFQVTNASVSNMPVVTTYNAITTAGQGLVPIAGATSQKAETGSADTNVLTVTPAAAVGTYRACAVVSVSSATSGVISWTLSWTDSNGTAQSNIAQDLFQQGTAAPNTTFTTSAAGNYNGCTTFDVNNAGAAIVVKWVGGGTTAAKMSATVERII